MKKAFAIISMVVLLAGLTVAANATWDNWAFFLRASDTAYANFGSQIQAQAKTGSADGFGTGDAALGTTTTGAAKVAFNNPTWPVANGTTLYKTDIRGANYGVDPLNYNVPKVWDIVVWLGTGYTGAVANPGAFRLAWWIPTTADVDMGTAFPVKGLKSFKLEIVEDPTGQHAPGTLIDWKYGDGVKEGGSSGAPFGYIDWTAENTAGLKVADADAATAGIKLRLTVVPEPSSLLILASGLTSLAGLALRRRR